jgi:hypothetical protein
MKWLEPAHEYEHIQPVRLGRHDQGLPPFPQAIRLRMPDTLAYLEDESARDRLSIGRVLNAAHCQINPSGRLG